MLVHQLAALLLACWAVSVPMVSAVMTANRYVVGYYADWTSSRLGPDNIAYNKLTHINYAFGVLKNDYTVELTSGNLLDTVVKNAHSHKVKVLLSVGGWSGSEFFSPMAKSAEGRQKTIDSLMDYVDQHRLDGLDIDWEFPGRVGMPCNQFDAQNDTKNLLAFLQELRKALDAKYKDEPKLLTMAVRVEPFDGPNGPLTDLKTHANLLDFITIMAYDINGGWEKTSGPNAPLTTQSGKGAQFSLTQSVQAWMSAGFPASKLVAGLAMYGRAVTVTSTMDGKSQYAAIASTVPRGDKDDALWKTPGCDKEQEAYSGIWKWCNLKSEGLLASASTAGQGWKRYWDETTQTPWLYGNNTFISYDDPQSLTAKVNYVLAQKLSGVMVWELSQDREAELLTHVHKALNGKPSYQCRAPSH
ncbi:hypothetical protein H4R34_000692 [Dimargaris verticillata]|uniref:GH18 domain-containing protein n=1 Tax=Dimargaris verticillata TaxID=2761393 RepID=A0A9W8B7L1_9FUNG|nr:hypothetical protein H4R34_000692 [Dimargaris verticillata]